MGPPVQCDGAGGSPGSRKEQIVRKLQQFVSDFVRREDGPTAVEYAVMLALIIVVCITAITTLGQNANNTFQNVGNAIGSTGS
jgi:pilus assembly protein Flp/PilA